jgi:trimethylamine--corrinoid protein Co-methyltransferase
MRRDGGDGIGTAQFGRLAEQDCARLHQATVDVLSRTGLVMDEPEALALLSGAGATTDGTRVRIPEKLVEWGLSVAPREVSLFDRDGRRVIRLHGDNVYFGPGSDCMNCLDHRTGQTRRAAMADVRDAVRVADACTNLDFIMSLFSPSDVTPQLMDRYQMEAMLSLSSKPVVYVTLNDEQAHIDAIAMAEAVVGGAKALEERPILACYKNTLFPLVHNREALRTLLDLSGRGLPCIYSPVSTAGTVAPMTVAGSVVVVNAGVLAGLVVSQLKREGAPFVAIGWAGETLDMRTMVDVYAGPDHRGVYASLLHWYGLPMWTLGGVSDAKLADQQAAAEAALTMLADAVCGGHMIHDAGYLESAFTGSLTQLVLCDEIAAWVRAFTAPVDLSDEALALDVIDAVGPGGLFLLHKHTRRHARDSFQPRLFDRNTRERWASAGALDATSRAAARVDEILATPAAKALPEDCRRAVHSVIERAESRLSR